MRKTILPAPLWTYTSFRMILFTCVFSMISLLSEAQCFASSTVSGSSAVNDAGTGTLDFNNLGNSFSSDNNRASATALVALFNGSTHYLKVTGFGFSIPSYASICGIGVEIEKRAGGLAIGAWVRDNDIRIVKANAVSGTDGGDDVTDWGSEAIYTYGGTNDLWGTTLTPADVNSSNFGVAISAQIKGLAIVFPSAQIDNIRVTVYYNPILPVKLLSFNGSLKNNIARLDWETADEADNESITVQRSIAGGSEWTDLARYDLHNENQRKRYSYTDLLHQTGNYAYRLKISSNNHQPTFSEIKQIVYSAAGSPVLYPNPARDCIAVDNLDDTRSITITNLAQQRLNLSVELTGEHSVKINTSRLPRGIYFIGAGSQKLKFFKE